MFVRKSTQNIVLQIKASYQSMIRSFQGMIRSYQGMIRLFHDTQQNFINNDIRMEYFVC